MRRSQISFPSPFPTPGSSSRERILRTQFWLAPRVNGKATLTPLHRTENVREISPISPVPSPTH
jgi:hypothetical protein